MLISVMIVNKLSFFCKVAALFLPYICVISCFRRTYRGIENNESTTSSVTSVAVAQVQTDVLWIMPFRD